MAVIKNKKNIIKENPFNNAKKIKGYLMNYFVCRGMSCATECYTMDGCIADLLAYNSKEELFYEVEIKNNIKDFKADFLKRKYEKDNFTNANFFYFAVPDYMIRDVYNILSKKSKLNYKYKYIGIISYVEKVCIVKRAFDFYSSNRDVKIRKILFNNILNRSSSELADFYSKFILN